MVVLLNTPNYGFDTPIEGGDDDIWGGSLNDNWTALDAILQGIEQQITDAIEAARIKVGDLYFSADASNPAAKLGYGTWVAHAAGRAIVGVGSNGTSAWTVNQTRGAETHTLTQARSGCVHHKSCHSQQTLTRLITKHLFALSHC